MEEIPESPTSNFLDAQVPDAVLPDSSTQSSFDQLLFPIELSSTRSATPVSDRPTIEEDGGRRDRHGNAAALFGFGSLENPIMPQHDNTVLESGSRPSARPVQAWLSGLGTCTLQQSGGSYSRERSPAALSKVENARGLEGPAMYKRDIEPLLPTTVQSLEDALCGDTPIEPVAMARETSHNTDATLTDEIEPCGDTSVHKAGTILWKHVAFYIVRSSHQGRPSSLLAEVTVPRIGSGDDFPKMKSFAIQHNPNQLFDILGYLLALAIHDGIFVTEFGNVEEVYRIEIPPHRNHVELEVKGTKLDLPIYRRPAHLSNESRASVNPPPAPICPSILDEGTHLGSPGSSLGASLPIDLRSQLCSSRCAHWELYHCPLSTPSDWRPWWSGSVQPAINTFLVQCNSPIDCQTLTAVGYCPKYLGNPALSASAPMNQSFDLEAWKARMTRWVQILEGSSVPGGFEVHKLLDYSSVPRCPLPQRTKSREGVPKGTKRNRPDTAAGGEVPTTTYRRKRRCVNLASLKTTEITKSQASSSTPREPRVEQRRVMSYPNPAVLGDSPPSPSTTGPSTSAVNNGLLDPDLLCSKNSTSRPSPPAASQDITAAQEDESELPSLESLLGFGSTCPHSEYALNQRILTESALLTQGSAELPGSTSVSILQKPSDREFDTQAPLISNAREARRLKDKLVVTSGNSSTSRRSNRGTGKCPGCGADVRPSSKRPLKRLSARQQRAFCEAHKRKDELETAETEWAVRRYPAIDWQKLGARLQKFSPALRGILDGTTPSFYRSELKSPVVRSINPKFCCMENTTAGYYGPHGQQVMIQHIIFELKSDFPQRMLKDPLLRTVGVGAYVATVLVPELAVMLIKEDMEVDDETAREILQKSAGLGETLHEDV